MTRAPSRLTELTDGVHLWLPDGGGTWGWANCLLVTGDDASEAALIDTPYTARLTRRLQAAARDVLPEGAEIGTVVITHANGDHSFGSCLFPGAEIVASGAAAEHARAEPGPDGMQALVDGTDPATPIGWYLRAHFPHDYSGLTPAPPTRTVTGRETLRVGGQPMEVIEVGPAHTEGDLIVHLPRQRTVAAGDIVFIGDHPVHWAGPIDRIIGACETVLGLDPLHIVPGHGPVIGPDGLREHIAYLRALRDSVHASHAKGHTVGEAAEALLEANDHLGWGLAERQYIVAAIEYRHLNGEAAAPDIAELLIAAAGVAWEREGAGRGEGGPVPRQRTWAQEDPTRA